VVGGRGRYRKGAWIATEKEERVEKPNLQEKNVGGIRWHNGGEGIRAGIVLYQPGVARPETVSKEKEKIKKKRAKDKSIILSVGWECSI